MSTQGTPGNELPTLSSEPAEISRFVVEAATHAPSVLNTQPWWFSTADREVSLHADVDRRLKVADPPGREMMISCGAALLTARVALRYLSLMPKVSVLPDPDLPNLVARIRYGPEEAAPAEYERDLYAEIPRRHTHSGAFDPAPLPESLIVLLREEASRAGATLVILNDENSRGALAGAVQAGEYALRLDPRRASEQARWTPPPGSRRKSGVPASAYPATPSQTEPTFPSRDFAHGHGWGLPPDETAEVPKSAGLVCVLATKLDRPEDWIDAGQALQRVLLTAGSCGVTAAMHTQPLEVPELRSFIASALSDGWFPQMVIRLGTTDQKSVSVRRSLEEVLL
ncbi:MAG: hypothetical protein LBV34_14015 [Nocardiopsaceae bacterium]|jgi:hypothetical protein|nr:hypothetical protein [Nocardiopsaceae bacterium]